MFNILQSYASKEVDKLASKHETWPTFTQKKLTEEGDVKLYQSQELQNFPDAEAYYFAHYAEYCKKVMVCIKSRLAWSDLEVMCDIIIVVLSTQGWEKLVEENAFMDSISRLIDRFKIPLKGAGASIEEIDGEFKQMVDYAIQYISLSTLHYHNVWWQLFHAPNIAHLLAEFLFSLPASNDKVERLFSVVNSIKVQKRSLLCNDS